MNQPRALADRVLLAAFVVADDGSRPERAHRLDLPRMLHRLLKPGQRISQSTVAFVGVLCTRPWSKMGVFRRCEGEAHGFTRRVARAISFSHSGYGSSPASFIGHANRRGKAISKPPLANPATMRRAAASGLIINGIG